MTAIRLEQVSKSFGETHVLKNISLDIEDGEFLTVIGRSGCGKTTMLRLMNGLIEPDEGKIYVEGEDISRTNLIALRRRIGYVIQNRGLFPHMT
ncbi:MAG: ATP-binding cassette domain-containing protein, partial [Lachnospiraceae bacterium]|nr:ATP-binding cassette domain-containing protein [Lachnospiraceae bacterium]